MLRKILFVAGLILANPAQATPVGQQERSIPAPHHGRDMSVTLFYPAQPGTAPVVTAAENAVFFGHPVLPDATPAPGRYPVILMSHGLGGLTRSLTWLGTALAQRGAIVVGVDHPNSSFGDFDMQTGINHWTRAQDFEVALQQLLGDPQWAPLAEPERIYATGFSYGGWTALSLGGLRGDATGYAQYCARSQGESAHCNDLAAAGVDLTQVDAEKWQASRRMPQIKAIAAIDPGLTYGISQDMADDLAVPALLITLGDRDDRLQATDLSDAGSGLWRSLPKAARLVLSPASHFTALPLCKPQGAALLAADQDDPVCSDPSGTSRAAVHAAIAAAIAAHFRL